jgi:hypothetical protein
MKKIIYIILTLTLLTACASHSKCDAYGKVDYKSNKV